jgi:hypothetical protein
MTHHRTNVGRSLSEDTRPPVKVRCPVVLRRLIPGLIEVIEHDIGVLDDEVSVKMVNQVVPDRQIDPLAAINEGLAILGAGDDLELILGADTACESQPLISRMFRLNKLTPQQQLR